MIAKDIKIVLEKEEELTPEFMDMFAKFIVQNGDAIAGLHSEIKGEMKYGELSEYMLNASKIKYNVLKSPGHKPLQSQKLSFNFQSKSNTLVFMLDLSSYMLLYNYGCKSFPLKNLQEIIICLLKKLSLRYQQNKEYSYKISIYLFSVYRKSVDIILLNEPISEWCIDLLCEFVSLTIEQSKLPYLTEIQSYSIGELLQLVFNGQQSTVGIKSLVVISSFNQEQQIPLMLFTPNWYTYSFINTGGHFGSYKIQNESLYRRLIPGICFKTKFVLKSLFLQNWQMTDIVKKENPSITKPVTEKFRSIQFQYKDKIFSDIFQLILNFGVEFKQDVGSKIKTGESSIISPMKDNSNRIVLKTYNIPADSFFYVLRMRYIQGWEPVLTNSMAVENSKFKLRLPIEQDHILFYEACRTKDHFRIVIFEYIKALSHEPNKFFSSYDKTDQLNMIEKIDKMISYDFASIATAEHLTLNSLDRKNSLRGYFFHQHSEKEIVSYIYNVKEWGKFFKIKRICFKFEPHFSAGNLEEFTNEVSYILGKRLTNNIFIKQLEGEIRSSDKIEDCDTFQRKVMLTKINLFANVIELKIGFLRFPYKEIKGTIQTLKSKAFERKLKKGVEVVPIPTHVSLIYKKKQISEHSMFNRKWALKFKSTYYRKIFTIYWESVLRKLNYYQIYLKSNDNHNKNYYRIIDVRNDDNDVRELVTFLAVKESVDKNQMLFHFSVSPTFAPVLPFSKESSSKPIAVPELVAMISQELKKTQQQLVKLVDTYQAVHYKLLRITLNGKPKMINPSIEEQITTLYDLRSYSNYSFPVNVNWSCKELITKYYKDISKQKNYIIPTPSKLLMATNLDCVQGDLNLTIQGKNYSFFLCSPFKFVYLQKREKSLYYKFVNMYYEQFNNRENENGFIELLLKEIVLRINEQVYIKDFQTFLEGNFTGGISKIISNQQFTHLEVRNVNLTDIFHRCEKYYISKIAPGSLEEERSRVTLDVFTRKLFMLIQEFFPLQRQKYYFQIRNKDQKEPPFKIDPAISRCNTELFMRMQFSNSNGDRSDVIPENLSSLIIKNFQQVQMGTAGILFQFYLKAKNNNAKSMLFMSTFTNYIDELCEEISYEMERSLLYKKDTLAYNLDSFSFLWAKSIASDVSLFLINKQCEKVEKLCKYIEHEVMQHQLPLKRLRPHGHQYMIIEEKIQKEIILVKQPFLLRVHKDKLEYFCHKSRTFFSNQQLSFKKKLEEWYFPHLSNFINSCVLMDELLQSYELPLCPYELWMSENINNSSNKFTTTNKKMTKRNPIISKFLAKKVTTTPQQSSPPSSYSGSSIKIRLSQLYRNFLPLNDRTALNITLNYLSMNQIFNLSVIHNIRNTYLFEKFYENNNFIFYFQEIQDQNIIREIAEENREPNYIKCKNYLVYYAFCLNTLLQPKVIHKKLLPHLYQVLHRQQFDDVSRFLQKNHKVIQEFEENFIKRKEDEEKKEIKFDIPQQLPKEQILYYIIQHIEVYHYRVEFKSQRDKTKAEASQNSRFIDSLRYVEPVKHDMTKSEVKYIEASSSQVTTSLGDRRMSQPNEYCSMSVTPLAGNRILFDSSPISSSSFRGSQMMSFENQSQMLYQTLDYTWLFNCQKADQFLAEKYGKCLYFLKLKFREESSRMLDQECGQIFKVNYLFTKLDSSWNFQEAKPLIRRNSGKIKKEINLRSILNFQIAEYVGAPNFIKIEDTFHFIAKACLAETYLQNYFYRSFSSTMRQFAFFKEEKKKSVQTKEKDAFYKEKVWPNLYSCAKQLKSTLSENDSLLFLKYASNNCLLMKDFSFYFLHFLEYFSSSIIQLKKAKTSKQQLSFQILFAAKTEQGESVFLLGNLRNTKKLREDIQGLINNNSFASMSFIATDYISIIKHYLTGSNQKATKSDASLPPITFNINDFKYFKDYEYKDDYRFKRSAFIFYEITPVNFIYSSYNIRSELDDDIRDYLSAMDCWLTQKGKIFSLIKNIKENNTYEIIASKPEGQKPTDIFYKLRKPQQNEGKGKIEVKLGGMYQLMINLIFKDLPEIIDKKDNLPKESGKLKYAHHHTQIQEMFTILKQSIIEYKKYPSYKGNEKFALERLGREYVSILRCQFGDSNS